MSQQLNILVGLDGTIMDDHLIAFLEQNASKITSQPVKILHATNSNERSNETIISKIIEKLPDSLRNAELLVKNGVPEQELQQLGEAMKVDLLVVGQKPDKMQHVATKKLAEKAATSLLVVPVQKDYKIQRIYVALDFTPYSMAVLHQAQAIATSLKAQLEGVHTYEVPSGYHKTGKDHWEFAKEMEHNAQNEASAFLKKAGMELPIHYLYEENRSTAECIVEFVEGQSVDLLIMGSEGRTSAASLIHSSVAKKVTKEIRHIPLMILKMNDKNMDVWDALKEV